MKQIKIFKVRSFKLTATVIAVLYAISSFVIMAQSTNTEQELFDTIKSRIKKDVEGAVNLEKTIESIDDFSPLYDTKNGSFSDVEYTSTVRTNWPPIKHLNRMKELTFAYTMPGNKYFEDELTYEKIEKGMQFWYDKNPHCSNWWYNQISEPQRIGVILLQMRNGKKKLPKELEEKTIERLKKDGGDPAKQNGANKIDVALHWLYRACLTEDVSLLKETLTHAYLPLKYVTGEGIQHDNSYFQHGQQLYIGGYGDELIKGVLLFALYVENTEYALSGEKLNIFSKFFRETYLGVIRGQYFLFDILGRGMSRKNSTFKRGAATFVEKMKRIDLDKHEKEYEQASKRLKKEEAASYGINPRNRHYFRADYTLHTRPEYTFDVRMVSTRTVRCEMGNGENLKTYFLSDGCTNIAVDGDEYAEIFPVWNWTRIPGVTCPQVSNIPKDEAYGGRGKASFVGGASDSLYSVSTYSYYDRFKNVNTGASKSWFKFDEEIVCLGSNINSSSNFEINTTVNQCLNTGDITVRSDGENKTVTTGEHKYNNNINWVHHNKVAYFFPNGGNIAVANNKQTGSWYDINHTQNKENVEKDVFTLWFNHGKSPQKLQYAYIVVPDKELIADVEAHPIENIEILINSDSIQVVRHKALDIWQMVFFKPCSFTHEELSIKVDKSCALMLKDVAKSTVEMHIADPSQAKKKIKVTTYIPTISDKVKETICDFSKLDNIYAGKTQKYKINANSEDIKFEAKVKKIEEISVNADSFVQKGAPDKNFGEEHRVIIKNDIMKNSALSTDRKGFFKFPIPKIQMSEGESIGNIYLRLYLIQAGNTVKTIRWTIAGVEDQTWNESEVTYSNMPSAGKVLDSTKGIPFTDDKGGIDSKNYITFNITEYVKNQINGNKENFSLMLYNNKRGDIGKHDSQFATKENENAEKHPKLIVEITDKNTTESSVIIINPNNLKTEPSSGIYGIEKAKTFKLKVNSKNKDSKEIYLLVNGKKRVNFKSKNDDVYEFEIEIEEDNIVISIQEEEQKDIPNKVNTIVKNTEAIQYPNPTKAGAISYVTSKEDDIIEIYKLDGQKIKSYRASSGLTPIIIENKGFYIVKIRNKEGISEGIKVIVN